MSDMTQIAARIPTALVTEIDASAREDNRSTRTDQLAYLLEIGLAGRRRLKALEAAAGAVEGVNAMSRSAGAAASAHLTEHARLTRNTKETSDG